MEQRDTDREKASVSHISMIGRMEKISELWKLRTQTIIRITRNTSEECQEELEGQLSDGIFENSRVGVIEELKGE